MSSTATPTDPREQDQICPICLVDKAQTTLAVAGSCGHAFCTDCLGQYFALAPSFTADDPCGGDTNDYTNDNDDERFHVLNVQYLQDCNFDGVATLKGCPLCRCPMSLLELKYAATSNNDDSFREQQKQKQPVWGTSRQLDLASTPLAGKIYATRRGIGYNSFHFPPFATDDEEESDDYTNNLPYFLWEEEAAMFSSSTNNQEGNEENTTTARRGTKYYFQPGCFYFAPKRSFHGQLMLPVADGKTLQPHDVLLDFAANHRWITGGILFGHPSTPEQRQSTMTHPLEGRWKVTWYNQVLEPDACLEQQPESNVISTAHITVVDNCVLDEPQALVYQLYYPPQPQNDESESSSPQAPAPPIYFRWPGYGVTQTLEAGSDFRTTSGSFSIPAIGDYLRWTTTDPDQPFIVWQRETITDLSTTTGTCTTTSNIKPNITYFGRSGDRNNSSNNNNHGDPFFRQQQQRNTSETWYREWRGSNSILLQDGVGRNTTTTNNNNNNNNNTSNNSRNNATNHDPGRPPYFKDRLWGNCFCQGLRVGLASYHFGIAPPSSPTTGNDNNNNNSNNDDDDDDQQARGTPFAYISYENDMCSQWPPLDDGSPIPPQVHFHNISLERVDAEEEEEEQADPDNPASARTAAPHYVFRGTIEWLEDYSTTWQNHERWEYEMHFDSEFTCIVSGTVHCVTPTSNNNNNDDPSSSRQEMSRFGSDLVYINAGICNVFDTWMNDDNDDNSHGLGYEGGATTIGGGRNNGSSNNNNEDELPPSPPGDTETPADVYPRYTHFSRALRRRLQAEGASVRTVAMLNMIFTHSLQPGGDSPIDYNA